MTEAQEEEWQRLVRMAKWGISQGKQTIIVDLHIIQAIEEERRLHKSKRDR